MNAADRRKLQENYEKLVNDAKYYQVSGHLISKFVIDLRMDSEIKSAKTEQEQMEKLLAILQTRGEHSFNHFVVALRTSSPWLADALTQDSGPANLKDRQKDENENEKSLKVSDVSIADFIPEIRRTLEKSPTVCKQWRVVAYTMRLHHTTVLDIEENNRNRTSSALYDVLRSWVDEFGQQATFYRLINILKCERMVFAADEVEELWIKLCSSPAAPSCKLS